MVYNFVMPHMSIFGSNCIKEIGTEAKANKLKKALIVTDRVLKEAGIAEKIEKVLKDNEIEYITYSDVQQNPTTVNVNNGAGYFIENNCDFIIGLGGGSPHDCAKAIGILVSNGGKINDYEGFNKSKKKAPIIFTVNTTAGTASEISRAYLISDEASKNKMIFKDINALPYIAFNDPDLMVNLPGKLTASTGMDALTHAIESYVSNGAYLLTRKLSLSAIEIIFQNLYEVIQNPKSIELRENMIYAQYLAGMAFGNGGLGLVHAMAHQLGAVYNLPHGLCNAILLPYVMKYNKKSSYEGYAEIAKTLYPIECNNKSAAQKADILINAVEELSKKIGTFISLNELGVKQNDLQLLAKKSLKDGNIARNPVMPTEEEIIEIFKQAL
jgi:alcohol dehydrogenase